MPTTSASIVVNFGEAKQKTLENVQISVRNTPSGLVANAIGNASINVQVIGSSKYYLCNRWCLWFIKYWNFIC